LTPATWYEFAVTLATIVARFIVILFWAIIAVSALALDVIIPAIAPAIIGSADPFDVFVEELALDVPTGGDVDLVGWVSLGVADGPTGSGFGFIER